MIILSNYTTIQVDTSIVNELNEIKDHPRQSYKEVIAMLIRLFKDVKKRNQYDEFLHKIQQPKMKELWDNPEDEDWEHA